MKTKQKQDGTIIQTEEDLLMEKLVKYPNVIGYATDIGKITAGENTGEPCLTVFVTKKLEKTQLKSKNIVPESIDDKKTDVVEIGTVTAPPTYSMMPEATDIRKKKHRPFKMGISISNITVSAGTPGGVVLLNGKKHAATNTHVGCESIRKDLKDQERANCQPGTYDGGSNDDIFGAVRKAIIMPTGQPAFNDFCIIEPDDEDDIDPDIYEIGIPTGVCTVKIGDQVQKSGRTTGLTSGKVTSLSATILVSYGEGTVTHKACILVTDMSDGGDSGSWMLKGTEVWGYLFAGSDTTTVCHEIQNATSATGCSVYTEQNTEPDFLLVFELEKESDGNYTLTGRAIDKKEKYPLAGATISIGTKSSVTSGNGECKIEDLQEGAYIAACTMEGYKTKIMEIYIDENGITPRHLSTNSGAMTNWCSTWSFN